MQEISNYYFKTHYEDPVRLISGLPLPDPSKGLDCDFHPAVGRELVSRYPNSQFINCYGCNEAEQLSERNQ